MRAPDRDLQGFNDSSIRGGTDLTENCYEEEQIEVAGVIYIISHYIYRCPPVRFECPSLIHTRCSGYYQCEKNTVLRLILRSRNAEVQAELLLWYRSRSAIAVCLEKSQFWYRLLGFALKTWFERGEQCCPFGAVQKILFRDGNLL